MAYVIAQLSDIHIGGPAAGSGDRFSAAIVEINAMTLQPDLVLLTGDLTQDGTPDQWAEYQERLAELEAPAISMAGNHDHAIAELSGHRCVDAGPLWLVMMDSSASVFTEDDAAWLESQLSARPDSATVVAIHHPPFETGIWWMDCVGLAGAHLFEEVVRRHPQVIKVLSGHVHRPIQTQWDTCSLWVCPSTSVAVAADLDPAHDPAETAEPPSFSLHAYTGGSIVSHVVPVGASAARAPIVENAPDFITWVREQQRTSTATFHGSGVS